VTETHGETLHIRRRSPSRSAEPATRQPDRNPSPHTRSSRFRSPDWAGRSAAISRAPMGCRRWPSPSRVGLARSAFGW